MRNKEKDALQMAKKREDFLSNSYELFVKKNIESVSMLEVAKESGYGVATLYRYFPSKPILVVSVATWIWENAIEDTQIRNKENDFKELSAAEVLDLFLNFFIKIYKESRELLRFNQLFNIYICSEKIDSDVLKPYRDMIDNGKDIFHLIYEKGKQDHTIRTDESEEEMFSTLLHLMLAAATRYAIGLVYIPKKGFDAEKELSRLKEALLMRYVIPDQLK
ncbi:MAG: TetR/AcrR family transcriptional regulator [Lachnospiraceae bacterium]|nr:TetR/AcrR family transcriptional regulator [Lachnospiraceae bacterium]